MKATQAFRAALAEVLAQGLAAPLTESERRYFRTEPVAYARERLGVELMPHQQGLAYAVAGQWHKITPEMVLLGGMQNPGKRKIACRSSVKTGKSTELVVLALWYFECCRDETHGAKFLLTAAKGDQIRTVIWAELRRILRLAPHPPEGKQARDPSKGFISADESCVILGFTGRNAEAMAGQSGNLAIVVDEASALEKEKADAIAGNRAGGGDLGAFQLWLANPTRSSGPLYDAFHSQKEFYTTFHFDGAVIAEWNERQAKPTKFIITTAAIRESAAENGEHDPFHVVRMRGNFIEGESGKILPMVVIAAMQQRWADLWCGEDGPLKERALEERRASLFHTSKLGPLRIGFDPAGDKIGRDECGFAVVRGSVALEVYTRRALKKEQALAELWSLMTRYRVEGEIPELNVDVEGDIGNEYRIAIAAEAEERRTRRAGEAFRFHAIRSSSKNVRDPRNFVRVRDEIWKSIAVWSETGCVPGLPRLETELYAVNWIPLPTGHTTVTPKTAIRDAIHRSPDLADALCLAVYVGHSGADVVAAQLAGRSPDEGDHHDQNAPFYDPGDGGGEGDGDAGGGDDSDPFGWAR